jgi:hypothetical protein
MSNLIDFDKKRYNKYTKVPVNGQILSALKELRQDVENQGTGTMKLIGGIYITRDIKEVMMATVKPWEFGYQIKPTIDPGIFLRNIYIKLPGEKIMDVPQHERDPIMGSVFEAMIDQGNEFPSFELIADDCILVSQHFAVMFQFESNPNIVNPGR